MHVLSAALARKYRLQHVDRAVYGGAMVTECRSAHCMARMHVPTTAAGIQC